MLYFENGPILLTIPHKELNHGYCSAENFSSDSIRIRYSEKIEQVDLRGCLT